MKDIGFPLPLRYSERMSYARFALTRRLQQSIHRIGNSLCQPDVLITGAYFSGNLGDWTMGRVITDQGKQLSKSPGLSGYMPSNGRPQALIMGGGELGDEQHFRLAIERAGSPTRVAACGINPVYTFEALPTEMLNDIARMPYISVRSKEGAALMNRVLGRADVQYNPDPAFGLYGQFAKMRPLPVVPKRLGINLMTFYVSLQHRRIFDSDRTMTNVVADPGFKPLIDTAGWQYLQMMRSLILNAVAQGWEVVNIPFTVVDAIFANAVLGDLTVKRLRYSRDPQRVLKTLATCQKLVATRFHAHIFGLITGVPVASIGYAGKCLQLWKDLDLGNEPQVDRIAVCREPENSAKRLLESEGVTLTAERLTELSHAALQSIQNAYAAVCR